jgi:formylglycine-generating enzyme required for sulfatase activity
LGPDCGVFDFDDNGDVDLYDFAVFQLVFGMWPPAGMVLVPGGEFAMGCHAETGESCHSDELPVHDVYVDSFCVDVYEVTNQQYADGLNWAWAQGGLIRVSSGVVYKAVSTVPYCDTTTSSPLSRITWDGSTFGITAGKEDHPMVMVSWYGAVAYCNWRSAQHGLTPCYDLSAWTCDFGATGYRLPTEAEWEYAARGGEHSPYYAYPWGNTIDGSKANYSGSGDPYDGAGAPETTPVGYYDGEQTPAGSDMANSYGLYDMAGNVCEWCHDWYDEGYYGSSPYDNPHGPASGARRVLRGGSWYQSSSTLRSADRFRTWPGYRLRYLGFRVAAGT